MHSAEKPQPGPETKHKVVIDVSVDGNEQWAYVLNNVENLRKAFGPNAVAIEVVAHGKGLGMLVKASSEQKDRIKTLAADGVLFRACENSMRKKSITKDDLIPEAQPVDSGVAQIVRRQEAGWSYLKPGS
jgi:intracellular sulfur oxidation DsrE/DsrF family protein